MEFLVLFVVGFAGLYCHWFKKWYRRQTCNGFVDYMAGEKKHSMASLITLFVAIVTMQSLGDIELTKQVLANAFLIGFGIDSAINKDPVDDRG